MDNGQSANRQDPNRQSSKNRSMRMIQIKSYSLEEVFSAMGNRGRLSDGVTFRPNSPRMQLFLTKGVACVTCDIKGKIFILETHDIAIRPHLNLYAENDNGELVLMTKDHILPKSRGGANHLDNYQTMCTNCNRIKRNTIEDDNASNC